MVKCPTCGAEFEVPEDVAVAECPYCGTFFRVATGEAEREAHFYFPPEGGDPFGRLMRFVSRQCGVPHDIYSGSTYEEGVLHMVPVYFYHLHGRMKVWGKSKKLGEILTTVEEITDIGIPAVKGRLARLLEDYPFPLRGKRYFEPRVKQMGVYHEPELSRAEADLKAKAKLNTLLTSEAHSIVAEVKRTSAEKFDVVFKGLVHYPIWEVTYSYKGERYRGYVDGATGAVILAEYPITAKARAAQLALCCLFVGVGALLALFFAHIGGKALVASAYSLVAAGLASAPLFFRTVKRKLVGSEIDVLKEKFAKPEFMRRLNLAKLSQISIGAG